MRIVSFNLLLLSAFGRPFSHGTKSVEQQQPKHHHPAHLPRNNSGASPLLSADTYYSYWDATNDLGPETEESIKCTSNNARCEDGTVVPSETTGSATDSSSSANGVDGTIILSNESDISNSASVVDAGTNVSYENELPGGANAGTSSHEQSDSDSPVASNDQKPALKSKKYIKMAFAVAMAVVAVAAVAALMVSRNSKKANVVHALKGSMNRRIALFSNMAEHSSSLRRPSRRNDSLVDYNLHIDDKDTV